MSNLRLKAIPAAFAAAGLLSMGAVHAVNQASGTPKASVYAQGTFSPAAYAVVAVNLYAPKATEAATATGGFIFITLKSDQKAWGFAMSQEYDGTGGTHTVLHSLTTGTNTCSVKYVVSYDPAGIMGVDYGTASSTLTTTLAVSTCRTAFANQTGLPATTFLGTATKRNYNVIY